MKKLKIYKEKGEFVIERINEFNHATKRFFITKEGLIESLNSYKNAQNLDEYEIETDEELWATVINELQK